MTRQWQSNPKDYGGVRERRKEFIAFLASNLARAAEVSSHVLIFGELTTNAVRYGRVPMWVKATLSDGILEIDVEDSGDRFDLDRRLAEGPRSEGGRGLSIVRTLADSFAVEHSPSSTCKVRATIAI